MKMLVNNTAEKARKGAGAGAAPARHMLLSLQQKSNAQHYPAFKGIYHKPHISWVLGTLESQSFRM